MASYSYKHGRGKEKNALTYTDLSHTAEECETFQFLAGIGNTSVHPVPHLENEILPLMLFCEDPVFLLVLDLLLSIQLELINYVTINVCL